MGAKWYLIPPCLTLSIIRYLSRVKLSNPGKGVAPSPTSQCSSYWKGSLRVTLHYGRQLTLRVQKHAQKFAFIHKMIFYWQEDSKKFSEWKECNSSLFKNHKWNQTYVQIISSDFDPHWVPHTSGLVTQVSQAE